MARTLANRLFTALLFSLIALPCAADQSLEAVLIGGFTWNLNETDRATTDNQHKKSGRIVGGRSQKLFWQTPNCKFN